jgi:uncharacterized protein YjbI with pentapeptide repeats
MAAKKAGPPPTPPKKSSSPKKPLVPPDASSGFLVERPVSFWNRPLKADFPKLFASFGAAIGAFTFQKWDSGIKSILEAATAISLEAPPAQVAWRLIFISLARASDALIEEAVSFQLFNTDDKECAAKAARIAAKFEDETIELAPDFFEYPGKLSILKPFGETFAQWLGAWGIDEARAAAIRGRFTSYFVFELRRQWRRNHLAYEPLIRALKTPFDAACEKERSWLEYAASLQRQISEPMFDESFSLDDIYIPLRGVYAKKLRQKRGTKRVPGEKEEPETERHIVDLQDHLLDWVKNCQPDDVLRVLSGGPGSGKSSFCKIFAARNADALRAAGITTIFISLHHFEPDENLVTALQRHLVEDTRQLAYDPLDKDELAKRSVLLIFDGLDELSQQGYVGARVASDFVRVLTTTLSRLNNGQEAQLRVLITGREIVISSNKSEFHGERLLEMVPFCPTQEADHQWPKHGDAELLKTDQRDLWWQTYGALIRRGYTGLPQELATPQLREITAQPLLNYLVALALMRENIQFNEDTSLNDVYEDLIHAVHERAYEPAKGKSRRHSAIGDLSKEHFFLLLEEIALSAWHGNGRKTTITEIKKHMEEGGLLPIVEKLGQVEQGAKSGITKLLVAFFFRESEVKGAVTDDTFEFTHKSFGEYLTARRLVRLMGDIVEERQRHITNPTKGWAIPEALDRWAAITGTSRMDPYLFDFFTQEVTRSLRGAEEKTRIWRDIFRPLFRHAVLLGTPMQNRRATDFQTLSRWANHAEESLLAAYDACLNVGKRDDQEEPWPKDQPGAFGTWLHRIRGQRTSFSTESIPVGLRSLRILWLSGQNLDSQDLEGGELRGANLREVSLYFATLAHANLQDANLQGASCGQANFLGANLQGANLQGANFHGATLEDANFQGAILRGATLQDANLKSATLQGAIIENAHLQGASLQGANLEHANLFGTNIGDANLSGASLRGANLRNVNLEDADLENVDFEDADLQGANLEGARIRNNQLTEIQKKQIRGTPDWLT